jgi:adenine-specific DNA glycosylase
VGKIDLIQTHYPGDAWKIMISCILLNQTTNQQVRPVIVNFFKSFPTPDLIKESSLTKISGILQPTGFQNVKAARIVKFTQVWNSGERNPNNFPGIGPYGRDAWKIFIEGKTDFVACDKKLNLYLAEISSPKSF